MKLQTTRKPIYKKLLIPAGILVVIALGWIYFAHHFQKWPFLPAPSPASSQNISATNLATPTPDQVSSGTSAKEQAANAAQSSSSATQPATTPISVTFSSVQPGSTVYIRTLIGRVTTTATCTLQMSGPGGKTYTASAGTQALSTSSTCAGFNVPMTSLAPGAWKITVTVNDGSASGNASTETNL